jgi:hypothetical protein
LSVSALGVYILAIALYPYSIISVYRHRCFQLHLNVTTNGNVKLVTAAIGVRCQAAIIACLGRKKAEQI